ncbi:MAG: sigma 54-interacting transcriptional regulator [Victivallaceae bacterium]|nr:sigma 54-interacting transcriptional regulator [Victivallaceae bacterium]
MNRTPNLEMLVLNQISQVVMREKNASALLKQVLAILYREMGLLRGTVTLRKGDLLFIEASHGLSEIEMQRGKYRLGEGITGQVALSGKPRIIPDISREPEFLDRTGARGRNSHVAFICVPIIYKDEVIGTLSIDREMLPGSDLDRDFNLIEIVANLTAEAVQLGLSEHDERSRLIEENTRLRRELDRVARPPEMIGDCQAMRAVFSMLEKVAPSDATVLVRGGSGTGKELIARAIFRMGPRRDKPFVVVNSAALPENLIESELFGHEKGAFTGAVSRRVGLVEAADTGTIFLDEIGDLGPSMQVKLLRFIQERTFQRIGSNEEHRSDVRIIAATSRNLEKLMEKELFREDLYYRLNVFPIRLPDLTERRSDIPLLAEFFLDKFNKKHHRSIRRIAAPAMNMMRAYSWPGNVRELENCIERAVLAATDDAVHIYDLPSSIQAAAPAVSPGAVTGDFFTRVAQFERDLISSALHNNRGNVAAAARELDLTPRIMHYKIAKLDLKPGDFKNR